MALKRRTSTNEFTWSHVDSHCGNYLNGRGDELADQGANGVVKWLQILDAMRHPAGTPSPPLRVE